MRQDRLKKIFCNLFLMLNSVMILSQNTFAGDDPWEALNNGGGKLYQSVIFVSSLYRLLEIVGLFGCVITAVYYVIQIIFHPSTARGVNAGKEGLKWKMMLAFFICVGMSFMGLIWDLSLKMGGYK